jgi:hypothetical protein
MPKYYVSTGDMQAVLERDDPEQAAIDAIRTTEVEVFGLLTKVSEVGFEIHDNDILIDTQQLLEEIPGEDVEHP